MKHLLNTLFVTSQDIYLSLDGENVTAKRDKIVVARYPLHTLQGIVTFSYLGASPALMGACAEREVSLAFCTPQGKYLARVAGIVGGNVLLRREQYRVADNKEQSCSIARNMIVGKLYNARWSLERTKRDHPDRIDESDFENAIQIIKSQMTIAKDISKLDSLRGTEGVAASAYFNVFDQMILRNKKEFFFHGRNRRPPLDNVNALLSFAYSLLANECASALESVGLDAYVGVMHQERPGRKSMALDLMEEMRPIIADRVVLTVINNRIIAPNDFEKEGSGAVRMVESGRKKFLKAWQERKQESIMHPYLQEKMNWGLVPYVQAMLLARHLRGDIDAYPPFLWK